MRAPSATSTVGRSDAGSACAMLPPMVPRFRTAGSPTRAAASASAGADRRRSADAASSACVVSAPIRTAPALARDSSQFRNTADVDNRGGHRQPELEQRNQGVTAGEQLRARMRRDELLRLGERTGPVIVEVCGIHVRHPSVASRATHARASSASESTTPRKARARRSPRCRRCTWTQSYPPHRYPSLRADGAATGSRWRAPRCRAGRRHAGWHSPSSDPVSN